MQGMRLSKWMSVPIASPLRKELCQLVSGSFMTYGPESGKGEIQGEAGGKGGL